MRNKSLDHASHFVYRQFDASNNLLYVGICREHKKREIAHKASPWHSLIDRVEYVSFPNRKAAELAEAAAIRAEKPIFNGENRRSTKAIPKGFVAIEIAISCRDLIELRTREEWQASVERAHCGFLIRRRTEGMWSISKDGFLIGITKSEESCLRVAEQG